MANSPHFNMILNGWEIRGWGLGNIGGVDVSAVTFPLVLLAYTQLLNH